MKALKKQEDINLTTRWRSICLDFMKAYQDQDVDRMVSLCHNNSTVAFLPLGDAGKGSINEFGRQIWMALISAFPDIDNTVHNVRAEDGKINCIVNIRGTQAGDFAGIVSKGKSFDCEHIFVFTLDKKHQIKHLDVQWDHGEFEKQLS